MIGNPLRDSVSALPNGTNAIQDVESEFEARHEGKVKELVVDNSDSTVCIIAKHALFHLNQQRLSHLANFFFLIL